MKERKDPTDEQLMRRLRRRPESDRDPRYKNDPYWALRKQGYSDSYAKRAFRDQPPIFHERTVSTAIGELDPEEILFQPGSTWLELEAATRPRLSQESIAALTPRDREYIVWDHQVAGLGVRVRTTGFRSFVFYSRNHYTGKLKKRTIGKIAKVSLDEARQVARSYRIAALNEAEPTQN